MTAQQITKDPAYNAVDPTDFPSMMDVNRYGARSTAFDKIISATHDHFWDPLDKKYIDFDEPFDLEHEAMQPDDQIFALQRTACGGRLCQNADPHSTQAWVEYERLFARRAPEVGVNDDQWNKLDTFGDAYGVSTDLTPSP